MPHFYCLNCRMPVEKCEKKPGCPSYSFSRCCQALVQMHDKRCSMCRKNPISEEPPGQPLAKKAKITARQPGVGLSPPVQIASEFAIKMGLARQIPGAVPLAHCFFAQTSAAPPSEATAAPPSFTGGAAAAAQMPAGVVARQQLDAALAVANRRFGPPPAATAAPPSLAGSAGAAAGAAASSVMDSDLGVTGDRAGFCLHCYEWALPGDRKCLVHALSDRRPEESLFCYSEGCKEKVETTCTYCNTCIEKLFKRYFRKTSQDVLCPISGGGNNCLIRTLLKLIAPHLGERDAEGYVVMCRSRLIEEARASGHEPVGESTLLDARLHTEPILRILSHNPIELYRTLKDADENYALLHSTWF